MDHLEASMLRQTRTETRNAHKSDVVLLAARSAGIAADEAGTHTVVAAPLIYMSVTRRQTDTSFSNTFIFATVKGQKTTITRGMMTMRHTITQSIATGIETWSTPARL